MGLQAHLLVVVELKDQGEEKESLSQCAFRTETPA